MDALMCPRCQSICRVGELVCPKCNGLINPAGNTQMLESAKRVESGSSSNNAFGMVFIEAQKQITFCIHDMQLVLPNSDSLIIGRQDEYGEPAQPDVGLNQYGAAHCGVSRRHIKITRQRDMIYVMDMGSRNGTYLNNRQIHPNTRHILRSGDELRLGNLIVRVSF